VWCDPLYDGPVPAGDDEQVLQSRARFLSDGTEAGYAETLNDLREWRRVIAEHDAHAELVLWFEPDLFDQLNLVQLLTWLPRHLPATKPVRLICIGSFPGRPGFKGLGELTPPELASLFDGREPIAEAQYLLAERAWLAFRAPDPRSLDDLRQADTSALPFLAAALTRFLEDYPWTSDGLSRTERRLMQLAEPGPIRLAAAFPRMSDGERAWYTTDTSLADTAHSLASTVPPLAGLSNGDSPESHPLHRTITLTDIGRAVLRRERDRVATCGFDRWMGGVHVRSADHMWRWDDKRQGIVEGSTARGDRV
jgi:hypothetical protein